LEEADWEFQEHRKVWEAEEALQRLLKDSAEADWELQELPKAWEAEALPRRLKE
jgi:hypothetical protein